MNIAIAVPSPEQLSPKFALDSLPSIITYTKQNLKGVGSISLLYQTGVRTDKNRNLMIDKVLKDGNIDYILWLDADMYYNSDIICKYFEYDFDIIGCLYFKRSTPHNPIGYIKGDNPIKPFKQIDPLSLPKDTIVEVDGLGFGGVMVKTSVYQTMGDDKWMNYGVNYHLPFECEGQLTHDLEWCRNAQKYGFKIYLHTGVKPTHLAEYQVSQTDWERSKQPLLPTISVIMPTTDIEQAKKTAKQLSIRAGIEHKMLVVEDVDRSGFVATLNSVARKNPSNYYVYVAQDAFGGKDWLKKAYELIKDKGGLVAFNDGKWNGQLASFGMIEYEWVKKLYNGDLMFSGYNAHYGDTELSCIAKDENKLLYDPSIVLMEVDYNKEGKSVNPKDKALFNSRKLPSWNFS